MSDFFQSTPVGGGPWSPQTHAHRSVEKALALELRARPAKRICAPVVCALPSLPAVSDHAPVISYQAELKRKALHLGALALPIGLLVLGWATALWVLVPLAVIAVALDVARTRSQAVHRAIVWVFAPIMRPEEQPAFGGPVVINGATWMCVSAALCALVFPEPVAAAALAMLMVGDGAAAVVGRRFGRHRYPFSSKSIEGSAAFVATGFVTALPLVLLPLPGYTPLTLPQLVVGALAAAAIEALPLPINDNVRVPLLAGLVMLAVGSATG